MVSEDDWPGQGPLITTVDGRKVSTGAIAVSFSRWASCIIHLGNESASALEEPVPAIYFLAVKGRLEDSVQSPVWWTHTIALPKNSSVLHPLSKSYLQHSLIIGSSTALQSGSSEDRTHLHVWWNREW